MAQVVSYILLQVGQEAKEQEYAHTGGASIKKNVSWSQATAEMERVIRKEGNVEIEKLDVEVEFCCD